MPISIHGSKVCLKSTSLPLKLKTQQVCCLHSALGPRNIKKYKKTWKQDKPQGTELRSAPRAFCFNKLQGSRQVLVVYKLY